MNENYASKKDLVEASGIISCFILAAAGFCALCLIPMEYCREMMIISIAVVLFQFSIKLAQGTPAISKWLGRNARDPFISYPASTFSNRCCKP